MAKRINKRTIRDLVLLAISNDHDTKDLTADFIRRNRKGLPYTQFLQNHVRIIFKTTDNPELLTKGYQNWKDDISICLDKVTWSDLYYFVNRWQSRLRMADSRMNKPTKKSGTKEPEINTIKSVIKEKNQALSGKKRAEASRDKATSKAKDLSVKLTSEKSDNRKKDRIIKNDAKIIADLKKEINRLTREKLATEKQYQNLTTKYSALETKYNKVVNQ